MNIMVLKTRIVKYIAGLALALSVTACASTQQSVSHNKIISQNTPHAIALAHPAYKVEQLNITVPDALTVSEANVFIPIADIVWREDPVGNRKQQVERILSDGIVAGVAKVTEGRPVIMNVRLKRFHALTEKARYTVGGRHNVIFEYVLRDAKTGLPVTDVKKVNASIKGYGGARAMAAMERGETQKRRIEQHIADVMYKEMSGNTET